MAPVFRKESKNVEEFKSIVEPEIGQIIDVSAPVVTKKPLQEITQALVELRHDTMKNLLPQILAQVEIINTAMQDLKNLIRPHTGLNRANDDYPLFSQDFEVYKQCLQYKSTELMELIQDDVTFWDALKKKTQQFKPDDEVNTSYAPLDIRDDDYIELEKSAKAYQAPQLVQASLTGFTGPTRSMLTNLNKHLRSASIRYTPLLGNPSHKSKGIDFQWPRSEDLAVFADGAFELSQLNLKTSSSGMYLIGIGLGFTNGFSTPVLGPSSYSSVSIAARVYPLDLERPYS